LVFPRWVKHAQMKLRRHYRRHMDEMETRLATRDTNRIVRPFEWGLEWTEHWPCVAEVPRDGSDPATHLCRLSQAAVENSDLFFSYQTPLDFRLTGNILRFTSPVRSPFPENNTVHAQWFPTPGRSKRAVIVLPHWNAKFHEHGTLCRALQFLGISAMRVSLPYHDRRMPPELERADYTVSVNIAGTIDATRQAVIDTRACLDWLESQGYQKFGIVGTSLGSCYAFLTSAHEERLRVNVFNLFSLYFADVVWTGLTTQHIRQGLEGQIELDRLRDAWTATTPLSYVDKFARFPKQSLFLYATYDTTFLPEYSKAMLEQIRQRGLDHQVVVLPCGHYTLGRTPFQFLDGYHICSFLKKRL